MNEIERILSKPSDQRTSAELEYLRNHYADLTDDQRKQLETEDGDDDGPITPDPVEKTVETSLVETKDLGDGEIETVIATGSLDRHGEKISIAGLDTKKYMKNPVVQWAHDYSAPPIGRATKIWQDGNKLMGRVKLAVDESEFASTIYQLIKGKFLNAVSIGFIPLEMQDNVYTRSEMVEFSVVPVPANAEALITARKLGIDTDLLNTYHNIRMYKLEDILKKEVDQLTIGEINFLKEHLNDLTKKQVAKYASVLKEEGDTGAGDDNNSGDGDQNPNPNPNDPNNPQPGNDGNGTPAPDGGDTNVNVELKALKEEIERLKKSDPIIIKNINMSRGSTGAGEISKELKFLYYVQGVKSGNFDRYLSTVAKDAMNTSDDSVLVPPQEFVTEVTRLENDYGVARRFATVRRSSSGAGIKFLLGADDVEIFDTAEGGVKKSTKLSYDSQTLLWRKFAAILPITDELTEDAAIDLWNDATQRFARAFARREDELVFTENASGGNTKDGIVNATGTNVVTVSSYADVGYDDLVDMILGVPSESGNTGRWFINRAFLGIAMKLKDGNDRPMWTPGLGDSTPATLLGRPYTETEVLADTDGADPGDALAVYGDLRFSTLAERNQLSVRVFDTGLVGDPDDVDQSDQINLMTQDAQAMRVVKRMNAICRFPEAFSVLKIAGGS